MKKFLGGMVPFLLFHLVCCGSLIVFLYTSGYLLVIRNEGREKIFLIPILLLSGYLYYRMNKHSKCCAAKGYKTTGDKVKDGLLYCLFSFVIALAFMIYVFIPWWIPNYRGGIILP